MGRNNQLIELRNADGSICTALFMIDSNAYTGEGLNVYDNASLEYKGIRLTYGMSIDYLAMPGISKETKQRGAELITIHEDGSWDVEQIPLDSIQ